MHIYTREQTGLFIKTSYIIYNDFISGDTYHNTCCIDCIGSEIVSFGLRNAVLIAT